MTILFNTKINCIYPLHLLDNECFFFKTKCIKIKYIFFKLPIILFVNSIKFIINNYYTELKISKKIRKHNVRSRNTLCFSTKKPWDQKGLGKARSGSFKSPLWRGGSSIFGPISRNINIYLQKKNKKITFFYLLLNKRTYVFFVSLFPLIHNFNNIIEHLNQQKRIKGLFSNKIMYVILNNERNLIIQHNIFKSIASLNILHFLKCDFIIFLI